jgi:hypothetical protein
VGNEIDFEHYTSVEEYTRRYDAIVNAIRKINPQMQFVGLALEGHREWQYYTYFLNHSNHVSGTPIDWISYHFYALTESRDNVTLYETFFPQADNFIDEVKIIQSIRNLLSPLTKTTIDEGFKHRRCFSCRLFLVVFCPTTMFRIRRLFQTFIGTRVQRISPIFSLNCVFSKFQSLAKVNSLDSPHNILQFQ